MCLFFSGPPSTNDYHASFAYNNKIYVALHGLNQLWEYDPATSQWTWKLALFFNFSPYEYAKVFNYGSSFYFLNAKTKKLKAYDMSTNQWTDKTDFPGTATSYVAAANTAAKGYIMGGANGYHPNTPAYYVTLSENWEYDFAANTWTQKANTPGFGRLNAAAHTIGDKIYFGTGASVVPVVHPVTLQISWVPLMNSDWWEYNTVQNTWTQKASFAGGGRADTRGCVIGSKIYLGMGSTGYFVNVQSDFWEYNPSSNAWTQRAGYPPGEVFPPWHSILSLNNRGYSVVGRLIYFWKYTPPTVFVPVN